MKSQALAFLAQSPLLALPLFGLALFFVIFSVVILRVTLPKRGAFDAVSSLPLEKDESDV